MILVDTNVWIDYLNGTDNGYSSRLDNALWQGSVIQGDLIYLEILQGISSDRQYKLTKEKLDYLDCYDLFGPDMVHECAQNFRYLRRRGITTRSTTDVIIASFCILNGISLLSRDKDFIPFQKYLSLSLITVNA